MKITSPVAGYKGTGPGGLVFDKGVAQADELSPAVRRYLERHGYGIDGPARAPVEPVQPDSRDIHAADSAVGSRLRDAAVNPRADDFLPPTNAGKADPHGPEVAAPGLHAVPPAPIVPGPVIDDDPDQKDQERRETEAAQEVLVEGTDVGEAIPHNDGAVGPLGLSDPGSASTVAGNLPAGNANHGTWVDYAVGRGMTRDEAEKLSRNELRDRYFEPASDK